MKAYLGLLGFRGYDENGRIDYSSCACKTKYYQKVVNGKVFRIERVSKVWSLTYRINGVIKNSMKFQRNANLLNGFINAQ